VYQFVTWAGRGDSDETAEKITAISINRYICGLKAWHVFHGAQYPKDTEQRVKLLLKASGKQDSLIPKKPEKSPVQITDVREGARTDPSKVGGDPTGFEEAGTLHDRRDPQREDSRSWRGAAIETSASQAEQTLPSPSDREAPSTDELDL